jgi:hypothetical protein
MRARRDKLWEWRDRLFVFYSIMAHAGSYLREKELEGEEVHDLENDEGRNGKDVEREGEMDKE